MGIVQISTSKLKSPSFTVEEKKRKKSLLSEYNLKCGLQDEAASKNVLIRNGNSVLYQLRRVKKHSHFEFGAKGFKIWSKSYDCFCCHPSVAQF